MLNGYKSAGKSTSLTLMISLHMMDMPCYQCTCDAVEKKQIQDRTEYQMICQLLYFPLEFTDSDDAGNHPLCFLFRNDFGRHVEEVADANNQEERDTRSREKYRKLLLNFNESLTKNMGDYEKIVFYHFTAVYIDVVGNSQTYFRRNDLLTNHGRPFGEILKLLRQSLRLENRHTPFVIASSSYGSQRLKDQFSKALGKSGSGNFRSVTLPVWKLEHLKNTDGTLNEAGRQFCGLECTTDNICNECLYTITEKVSANPHMLQSLLCENENPFKVFLHPVKDSSCILKKYHPEKGSLLKSAIEANMTSIVEDTLRCSLRFNFFSANIMKCVLSGDSIIPESQLVHPNGFEFPDRLFQYKKTNECKDIKGARDIQVITDAFKETIEHWVVGVEETKRKELYDAFEHNDTVALKIHKDPSYAVKSGKSFLFEQHCEWLLSSGHGILSECETNTNDHSDMYETTVTVADALNKIMTEKKLQAAKDEAQNSSHDGSPRSKRKRRKKPIEVVTNLNARDFNKYLGNSKTHLEFHCERTQPGKDAENNLDGYDFAAVCKIDGMDSYCIFAVNYTLALTSRTGLAFCKLFI